MTFNGLVKQFEGETATVLLECDGQRQMRTMKRSLLRKNGVRHQGQAFTLEICGACHGVGMVEAPDPERWARCSRCNGKSTTIAPAGDPSKRTIKPIRPGADFSKFKDMP